MVLLIVTAITILATGFLAGADTELACGDNTRVRIETDQLAQSGLEHAKGLLLHPQEVPVDQNGCVTYWTGATGQQLVAPSSDYYQVTVVRNTDGLDDYCTYDIACAAYRGTGPDKKGESRLSAQLRLDPCIALGIGADTTTALWNGLTVQGDVYCAGRLVNQGTIHGDVFSDSLDGSIVGQHSTANPLAWPTVAVTDFTSRYGTLTLPPEVKSATWGPYNPLRVCHRNGDLILGGNATIDGMLLVEGNLTVRGVNNIVRAGKNLAALYVTANLIVEQGAHLTITGLAAVGGDIRVGGNTTVSVLGAVRSAGTGADGRGCVGKCEYGHTLRHAGLATCRSLRWGAPVRWSRRLWSDGELPHETPVDGRAYVYALGVDQAQRHPEGRGRYSREDRCCGHGQLLDPPVQRRRQQAHRLPSRRRVGH